MKRHIHTIQPADVGATFLVVEGRTLPLFKSIGTVQPIDIGKRVYEVKDTLRVESATHRNVRERGGD